MLSSVGHALDTEDARTSYSVRSTMELNKIRCCLFHDRGRKSSVKIKTIVRSPTQTCSKRSCLSVLIQLHFEADILRYTNYATPHGYTTTQNMVQSTRELSAQLEVTQPTVLNRLLALEKIQQDEK